MNQHLYHPQDFKEMEMEESHAQPGFTSQTEEGVSVAFILGPGQMLILAFELHLKKLQMLQSFIL